MWFYPVTSVIAFAGWAFILAASGLKFILWGIALIAVGVAAYLWRARVQAEWPFAAAGSQKSHMSAPRPLDVMVVGDLFAELVMSGFASWPDMPGKNYSRSVFAAKSAEEQQSQRAAWRNWGPKLGVVGVAGETDGQWLIERLESRGVNTSAIQRSSREPTAVTVSVSGANDRTFLTYMGANRELPANLKQIASRGDFANARHIHLAFAPKPAEADNLFREISRKVARFLSM